MQQLLDNLQLLWDKIVAGDRKTIIMFLSTVTAIVVVVTQLITALGRFAKKVALKGVNNFIPFILTEKVDISHDVRRFRFQLQSKYHVLGLPIGQHITFKYTNEKGEEVQRSYTPTTSDDEVGYVDFVIKVYFPTPQFQKGGQMSQHLDGLKIGDSLLMSGPKGQLDYAGKGKFSIKKLGSRDPPKNYQMKRIGMVCGGTGITPMLQVLRAILKDPKDMTEVWLIFANKSEEDILLRQELESISSERFHLWYTLDNSKDFPAPDNWKYGKGFISADICRGHLPEPSDDTMLWFCGPPPMWTHACEPSFQKLGFVESQWFKF